MFGNKSKAFKTVLSAVVPINSFLALCNIMNDTDIDEVAFRWFWYTKISLLVEVS